MAFDAFVKIQGIEGESEDERHQGWIKMIRYGIPQFENSKVDETSITKILQHYLGWMN